MAAMAAKTPTAPYLYWPVMIAQMASQPERYLKVAALLS